MRRKPPVAGGNLFLSVKPSFKTADSFMNEAGVLMNNLTESSHPNRSKQSLIQERSTAKRQMKVWKLMCICTISYGTTIQPFKKQSGITGILKLYHRMLLQHRHTVQPPSPQQGFSNWHLGTPRGPEKIRENLKEITRQSKNVKSLLNIITVSFTVFTLTSVYLFLLAPCIFFRILFYQ